MRHILFILLGIFVALFVAVVVAIALLKDEVTQSPESIKMKDYAIKK